MLFIGTYTVYIPVKILVFLRYGVVGLALATSVHLLVNFIVQTVVLEKTIAKLKLRQAVADANLN